MWYTNWKFKLLSLFLQEQSEHRCQITVPCESKETVEELVKAAEFFGGLEEIFGPIRIGHSSLYLNLLSQCPGPTDIEAILWANKVESRRCYLNQGRWQVLDVIGVEIMVIRNVFLVFDVSKLRRRFVALTSSKLNGEQRLTLFRTCMRQYSDTQVLSRAVCMIQRTKSWSSGSHELSRRQAA